MTRWGKRKSCILVVEDELLLAMFVHDELALAGYEVLGPVASHSEAVDLAVRHRPDLVLMDIRLKDSDGVAAAIEIWRRTGVRSLFATANTDVRTVERAQPAHPVGWLSKPYSVRALREAMEAV